VTPRVIDFALKQTERTSAKANRVFADLDVLLTPSIAHRPPKVGIIDGRGTIRSSLASMPAIAYAAIWNVAGNPAAAVPCGLADDGLPVSVQLVGRTDGEPTLLSLAAQIEAARPWPLVAPG
jgi:amidase